MNNTFKMWTEFLTIIRNNWQELVKNPITWIICGIIFVGIYELFISSGKNRGRGLGSVVIQLFHALINTTGDFLDALRSITAFIQVLRLLLFGKLDKRTTFIINNYAIVFLSITSFTTTFLGFRALVETPLALFVSFGIQVSIYVYASKLKEKNKSKNESEQKPAKYFLYSKDKDHFEFLENELFNCKNQTNGVNGKPKKEHTCLHKLTYVFLIACSIFLSSLFSYLFMFENQIANKLYLDDYFKTINTIHDIDNSYSTEMNEYLSALTGVLNQYNDKVSEWLQLAENDPSIKQNSLNMLLLEINEYNLRLDELNKNKNEWDQDTDEYLDVVEEIKNLKKEINGKQTDYNSQTNRLAMDADYQNRWTAYQSIQELTEFYGNALYLVDNNPEEIRIIFSNLQRAVAYFKGTDGFDDHTDFDDEKVMNIQAAFDNYVALNQMFSRQEKIGIDFSKLYDEMESISMDEFQKSMDYKRQTNLLLNMMLDALNGIPHFESVTNVWDQSIIIAPNQSPYLEQIYDIYRDNNLYNLDESNEKLKAATFERAIKILIEGNNEKIRLKAIILCLIALSIDSIIVALTLLRGKRYNSLQASDLRRLMSVMFIDDILDQERDVYNKQQGFFLTVGVFGGMLTYFLFRMNSSNDSDQYTGMVSLAFFVLLGFLLSLLTFRIYKMIKGKEKNWKEESSYLKLKEVLNGSGLSEEEFQQKIKELKYAKNYKEDDFDEEEIKHLKSLFEDEKVRRVFNKNFYDAAMYILDHMEMKECQKVVLTYQYLPNEDVRSISSINEFTNKIMLPCVSEETVQKSGMKAEFSVLLSRNLIFYDCVEEDINESDQSMEESAWQTLGKRVGQTMDESIGRIMEGNLEKGKKQVTVKKGYYILPMHFWNVLYDAVLLKVTGGILNEWNLEEELEDDYEEND